MSNPAGDLRTGVDRLISNLAVRMGISRERAIFLVECTLADLKRPPPRPFEAPGEEMPVEKAA